MQTTLRLLIVVQISIAYNFECGQVHQKLNLLKQIKIINSESTNV